VAARPPSDTCQVPEIPAPTMARPERPVSPVATEVPSGPSAGCELVYVLMTLRR
jgi:hypothetical protein